MVRGLLAIALIAGSLALASCHTVRGLGEDLESVGEAMDQAVS